MPAYAYAIGIKRARQRIKYTDEIRIEKDTLTLAELAAIGDDEFAIIEHDWREGGGYTFSVSRSRLETDEERDARVSREEAYMTEYNKRKGVQQ